VADCCEHRNEISGSIKRGTGSHGESKFFSLPFGACVLIQVLISMERVSSLVFQSVLVFSFRYWYPWRE